MRIFFSKEGSPTIIPQEVIRATTDEKEAQIATLNNPKAAAQYVYGATLRTLQQKAIANENLFEALMEATKFCSLEQVTNALYEVGDIMGKVNTASPHSAAKNAPHTKTNYACILPIDFRTNFNTNYETIFYSNHNTTFRTNYSCTND